MEAPAISHPKDSTGADLCLEKTFRRHQQRMRGRSAGKSAVRGAGVGAVFSLLWILLEKLAVVPPPTMTGVFVPVVIFFLLGWGIGWRMSARSATQWANLFDRRLGLSGGDSWSVWMESQTWPEPWGTAARHRLQRNPSMAEPLPLPRIRLGWREASACFLCLLLALWGFAGYLTAQREAALRQELSSAALELWQELAEAGIPQARLEEWREEWDRHLATTLPGEWEERWEWLAGVWREEAKALQERALAAQARFSDWETGTATSLPDARGIPRPARDLATDLLDRSPELSSMLEVSGQADAGSDDAGSVATPPGSSQETRMTASPNGDSSPANPQEGRAAAGSMERTMPLPESGMAGASSAGAEPASESAEGSSELAAAASADSVEAGPGALAPPAGGEQPTASSLQVEGSFPGEAVWDRVPAGEGMTLPLRSPNLNVVGEIISVLAAAERWDDRQDAGVALRAVAGERAESNTGPSVPLPHRAMVRRYFTALQEAGRSVPVVGPPSPDQSPR
jgi:hypothetical protein